MRSEYSRLRKLIQANQLSLFSGFTILIANRHFEAVREHHIVVATYVRNTLCRLSCPRLIVVIDLIHSHLRMVDSAYDTEFHALFVIRPTGNHRSFAVVRPRAAQSISHIIAERTNTRHLADIGFHCHQFSRVVGSSGCPSFAIKKQTLIYLIELFANGIHRLIIMNTHEVEAETIHMIFFHPITYGLQDELTHHGALAGSLIAATRSITPVAFFVQAVEIAGAGLLKLRIAQVVGMVIYHVHDHADAGLMERLNHLFHFYNTALGVTWIGAV